MQACLLTSDGMRRAVKFVNNAPTRTKAQFTAKGNHVYAAIDGHSPPTARAIGYTSSEAAAQSRTCVLTSCRHSSQSSGLIYQSDSIMDSITNFHVRTCRTVVDGIRDGSLRDARQWYASKVPRGLHEPAARYVLALDAEPLGEGGERG